ncbi:hypothetical protein Tco_0394365 [Tanacetum coccineum]
MDTEVNSKGLMPVRLGRCDVHHPVLNNMLVDNVPDVIIRDKKILAKVGTVAYRLELPEKLSRVHSTFHVSKLKKCLADEPLAIPLDEIQVDDKICNFIEDLSEVMT